MERSRAIRHVAQVGVLTVGLLGAGCVRAYEPVRTQINNAGQEIAGSLYRRELVPQNPDAQLVSSLREPIEKMRGDLLFKAGFRRSIAEALAILWEPKDGQDDPIDLDRQRRAVYSCVNEVAAATQISSSRLQRMTDSEAAYILVAIVDQGTRLTTRDGLPLKGCPFIGENLDPEQRTD